MLHQTFCAGVTTSRARTVNLVHMSHFVKRCRELGEVTCDLHAQLAATKDVLHTTQCEHMQASENLEELQGVMELLQVRVEEVSEERDRMAAYVEEMTTLQQTSERAHQLKAQQVDFLTQEKLRACEIARQLEIVALSSKNSSKGLAQQVAAELLQQQQEFCDSSSAQQRTFTAEMTALKVGHATDTAALEQRIELQHDDDNRIVSALCERYEAEIAALHVQHAAVMLLQQESDKVVELERVSERGRREIREQKTVLQQEKIVQQVKTVMQEEKRVLQEQAMMLEQEKTVLQQEATALQQDKTALQQEVTVLQQEATMLQQEKTALELCLLSVEQECLHSRKVRVRESAGKRARTRERACACM